MAREIGTAGSTGITTKIDNRFSRFVGGRCFGAPLSFVAALDFAGIPWHDCAARLADRLPGWNRPGGHPDKSAPPAGPRQTETRRTDIKLTRFIPNTLAALALSLSILPGLAVAQNGETVKATHGDWEVRCGEGDDKLCVIAQVGKTAEGKNALEVRIRKLDGAKGPDGKELPAAIQITTPLGSILRAGVRVSIDGAEPRTGIFEFCVPTGCVVRDAMSEEFLAKLKSGNTAAMTFTVLQRGDVTANISLKGFTKAFDAL